MMNACSIQHSLQQRETVAGPALALPTVASCSPPTFPADRRWLEVGWSVRLLGVRSWPSRVGGGDQEEAEEAAGVGQFESPKPGQQFPDVFRSGLWETANHPESRGSTFLSFLQLKIQFFLISGPTCPLPVT